MIRIHLWVSEPAKENLARAENRMRRNGQFQKIEKIIILSAQEITKTLFHMASAASMAGTRPRVSIMPRAMP
jgi:hypothetical protein